MTRIRPLLVMGTRPEAIKMAPVVSACHALGEQLDPLVCFTGQHDEMLRQVTDYFDIRPDFDFKLMTQFTSFVAVEEKIVNEGGRTRRVEVPVEMPDGVSYEGVFGRERPMVAAQSMAVGVVGGVPGGAPGGVIGGIVGNKAMEMRRDGRFEAVTVAPPPPRPAPATKAPEKTDPIVGR